MNAHMIGEIALNISTFIYFVWFFPQIRLTFKRKSISGLSLWMHGLLLTGYLADLVYGFGREMPIQYRMVTIFGLCSLGVEHYQFWKYGLKKLMERRVFHLINVFFISFFCYAIITITVDKQSKFFYDAAGMISNFCWMTFFIPQIVKNYVNKSTEGLSLGFVMLSLLSAVADLVSTYALNFDWPSRDYAPIVLVKQLFVLGQFVYYRKTPNGELALE